MAGKRDSGPAGLTARGRPALLAGGVAPLAQHALPLGEGKKELSRSSTTSRTTRASRCARASRPFILYAHAPLPRGRWG